MKIRRVAKALGIVAILCAFGATAFWYIGHRPISHHNDTLRGLIGTANQVELSLTPQYGAYGQIIDSDPPLVITGRSEIDQMLSYLELSWYQRSSDRFHECDGHLVVTVKTDDSREYRIQYDHGKGIYPISPPDGSTGFCNLAPESCAALNEIFYARGFSPRDLGIKN